MTALSRQIVAIVPAAGIGSRMQQNKPKQYLTLHGKTILEHTVSILLEYEAISRIILVVAENDPYIKQSALIHQPKIKLVKGGATRADSVLNGLKSIQRENVWALVHDAARPCLNRADLDKLLTIRDDNGAILAIPTIDTVKRADIHRQIRHTEDRSELWLAQTPQFFRADLLQQALESAFEQGFVVTDEASAMELAGFHPYLIEGRSDNIKVTRPEDLALVEFYLSRKTA